MITKEQRDALYEDFAQVTGEWITELSDRAKESISAHDRVALVRRCARLVMAASGEQSGPEGEAH